MKYLWKRAIALVIVTIFCAMLPLSVGAAGADPVNPTWSGTTATWQPPAGTVSHYELSLFKDGGYLNDYYTPGTSYDFSDTIKNSGPGEYTYSVYAVFEDTSKSNAVNSTAYSFAGVGHQHPLTHVGFSYATCTEDGVKEHYECATCNRYFWDAKGENEISDKSEVVLKAYGHSWGEWKITKKPTTTAEGKMERVCNEDPDHVETKAIPKLKSENETVTVPSATEKTTKATQSTTEATRPTTQPTTSHVTKAKAYDASHVMGMPTLLFWVIVVGAVLLLLVVPAVIVVILLLSRKKKQ